MAGKLRGKLNGKTTRGETVRELPEWVSISEAERLTGLSARTIKRMAAEGQLKSSRTPGSHMRVSRADVDRLLRRDAPASVSASSVLQNKRERVEELGLEARELRAQREIDKLREEGAQAERARALDRRGFTYLHSGVRSKKFNCNASRPPTTESKNSGNDSGNNGSVPG